MKTEIRKVTPEIARQLLELNTSNRPLKQSSINAYSKEMLKGNWSLTGEAIKISKTRKLLDGQHRLHAIVKSNKTVEMLIISDLDDDIFNKLDTGVMRTAGDVLAINGIKNPTLVAAIARFIINYSNGCYDTKNINKSTKPTNADIQKFVEENEFVLEIAQIVQKEYHKFKLLPVSLIGGMYFVLSKISVTDAELFFEKLINGLDLSPDCPIRGFRERLIRDSINKYKLPADEKVRLLVSAWNHYRKGSSIKNLQAIRKDKLVAI
jgi:hypothetical protein